MNTPHYRTGRTHVAGAAMDLFGEQYQVELGMPWMDDPDKRFEHRTDAVPIAKLPQLAGIHTSTRVPALQCTRDGVVHPIQQAPGVA